MSLGGGGLLITSSIPNDVLLGKSCHHMLQTHLGCHSILAKPNHSATRYRRRSGIVETINLEDDSHIIGNTHAFTAREREHLVVIKNTALQKERKTSVRSEWVHGKTAAETHLFRFSAHSGSTSPSKTTQCLRSDSPFWLSIMRLNKAVKTPSVHSSVVPSKVP
jgi:hypothetical protein